jgi:hypothetical protein
MSSHEEGLHLQSGSLIPHRRPLWPHSHKCNQACLHQAKDYHYWDKLELPSPLPSPPVVPGCPRVCEVHGSGLVTCLGSLGPPLAFPNFRLYFPNPELCLGTSLQPSICPSLGCGISAVNLPAFGLPKWPSSVAGQAEAYNRPSIKKESHAHCSPEDHLSWWSMLQSTGTTSSIYIWVHHKMLPDTFLSPCKLLLNLNKIHVPNMVLL